MRQSTEVTVYFSKQELSDAIELYVGSIHPALLGHFANGCEFEFVENLNTGGFAELAVTFRPRIENLMTSGADETRIFSKQK